MLRIYRVKNNSMRPTLEESDFVIVSTLRHHLKKGRLVVVKHSVYGVLIKRLKIINSDGSFLLKGDDDCSLTSEQMGSLVRTQIIGFVIFSVKNHRKRS